VQSVNDNFSYIIADEAVRDAAVVNVSYNASEIIRILKTEKRALKYIVCAHGHSDHTTGIWRCGPRWAGKWWLTAAAK
jgi:glyoxylase-like metal-dependent hydrolase (beta-lactamase superfamily II)